MPTKQEYSARLQPMLSEGLSSQLLSGPSGEDFRLKNWLERSVGFLRN